MSTDTVAGASFDLDEDHLSFREVCRNFVDREMKPLVPLCAALRPAHDTLFEVRERHAASRRARPRPRRSRAGVAPLRACRGGRRDGSGSRA